MELHFLHYELLLNVGMCYVILKRLVCSFMKICVLEIALQDLLKVRKLGTTATQIAKYRTSQNTIFLPRLKSHLMMYWYVYVGSF